MVYRLYYFPFRGVLEPIKLLLEYSGQDYEYYTLTNIDSFQFKKELTTAESLNKKQRLRKLEWNRIQESKTRATAEAAKKTGEVNVSRNQDQPTSSKQNSSKLPTETKVTTEPAKTKKFTRIPSKIAHMDHSLVDKKMANKTASRIPKLKMKVHLYGNEGRDRLTGNNGLVLDKKQLVTGSRLIKPTLIHDYGMPEKLDQPVNTEQNKTIGQYNSVSKIPSKSEVSFDQNSSNLKSFKIKREETKKEKPAKNVKINMPKKNTKENKKPTVATINPQNELPKQEIKKINPPIEPIASCVPKKNLPFLEDTKLKRVINQSFLICKYLADELGLEAETERQGQFLQSIYKKCRALSLDLTAVIYKPTEDRITWMNEYKESVLTARLQEFEDLFESSDSEAIHFLSGLEIKWTDFFFYELLARIDHFFENFIASFPKLYHYLHKFEAIGELKNYFEVRPKFLDPTDIESD